MRAKVLSRVTWCDFQQNVREDMEECRKKSGWKGVYLRVNLFVKSENTHSISRCYGWHLQIARGVVQMEAWMEMSAIWEVFNSPQNGHPKSTNVTGEHLRGCKG